MASSVKPSFDVEYPDSDGEPLGETGVHVRAIFHLYENLRWVIFLDRNDVYIAADMFLYYERGNPKAVKAPDLMVIKGVSHAEERRSFKLWEEHVNPCVIFEITSDSTRREDTHAKPDVYATLGVAEYFVFDPLGDYLDPPLRGYRLEGDQYVPIEPGPDGELASLQIGYKLGVYGEFVRFLDFETGEPMETYREKGLKVIAQDKINKSLLRDLAERDDLLEKERRKAKREAKKAETERLKAETERLKAEALEAEIKRLRALLGEG